MSSAISTTKGLNQHVHNLNGLVRASIAHVD